MNKNQLVLLMVVAAVVGGIGYNLSKKEKATWTDSAQKMGEKLLTTLKVEDINNVESITIKSTAGSLSLAKKGDVWGVPDRGDYVRRSQSETMSDESSGCGTDRHRAPRKQPVHAVDATKQCARNDLLTSGDCDDVPQHCSDAAQEECASRGVRIHEQGDCDVADGHQRDSCCENVLWTTRAEPIGDDPASDTAYRPHGQHNAEPEIREV